MHLIWVTLDVDDAGRSGWLDLVRAELMSFKVKKLNFSTLVAQKRMSMVVGRICHLRMNVQQ